MSQYLYGDVNPVVAPVNTAQAVANGDLVALTSNVITRAEDETWVTDLATTQTNFAAKYLGVSGQQKDAGKARVFGNSSDNVIRVDTSSVYEFDCASASFNVGDWVGPAKATGNALLSQTVVAVASSALAIGKVVEKTSSATKVKVRLLSTVLPLAK